MARRSSKSLSKLRSTRSCSAMSKGLYKKAIAGEIANFTGVSDPYEAPETPEILVSSDTETVVESGAKIIAYLEANGLIGTAQAKVA